MARAWELIHRSNLAGVHFRRRKGRSPNHPSPPIPPTPPTKKPGHDLTGTRAAMHRVMHATVGNPYGWTYNLVRPLALPKRRLTETELATATATKRALADLVYRYRSDCSWGSKTIDYLAGATDDPTGQNWTGWGNSGTIYAHLEKRYGLDNAYHPSPADLARCKVGDHVLIGRDGSLHAARIMEAGENPLLWSDGHQGAPNSYRLLDDARRPISVCIPKGLD